MIFINHRHLDAFQVQMLADGLRPLFGDEGLYVDRQLEPGDHWPDELTGALQRCDAMLAVIGDGWAGLPDATGQPRLNDPRDWVRREIETALQRQVLVVPVFLDGSTVPAPSELPASLQPLCECQGQALRQREWAADLRMLAATLARKLDVRRAQVGLSALGPLLRDPEAAMLLGSSRQGLSSIQAQIQLLQAHKTVHDALHHVDHDCQRTIRSGGLGSGRLFSARLAKLGDDVRTVLALKLLPPVLALDLEELLDAAEASMATAAQAVSSGQTPVLQGLLADLDALVSLSPELDSQMVGASSSLRLGTLVLLMGQVREQVATKVTADPQALPRLEQGIAALRAIDKRLQEGVAEHTTLQWVDRELRSAIALGLDLQALPKGWDKVRRRRQRLALRPSEPVAMALADCAEFERVIDAALAAGQAAQAASLMSEYFMRLGDLFLEVDTQLKETCRELADVAKALRQSLP